MSSGNVRTALITGGARGIGLCCATRMADAGHFVVLVDRDAEALKEAASGFHKDRVACIVADLTEKAAPEAIRAEVRKKGIADVSILINNAGIAPEYKGRRRNILEIDREEWDLMVQIMMTATAFISQQFIPDMQKQKWGRIVNISSAAARGASGISGPAYAASKSGIIGVTRHIASNFGRDGITANAIAPGLIETRMAGTLDPSIQQNSAQRNPTGRLGRPEEIAHAVAFFTTEEAGYCNGAVLDVNGGSHML